MPAETHVERVPLDRDDLVTLVCDLLGDLLGTPSDGDTRRELLRAPFHEIGVDELVLFELAELVESEVGERTVGFAVDDEDLTDLGSLAEFVDYVLAATSQVADESPVRSPGTPGDELGLRLGHPFTDPSLGALALRHRSWCAEHGGVESNERLEFLGDSVLGLVITERLYADCPDAEGRLARRRAELVSAPSLAAAARRIELGSLIALGKGELGTGGADKASILADALEAALGAVYLDGGLPAAREVIAGLFAGPLRDLSAVHAEGDPKSRLQELAAQRQAAVPVYRTTDSGPEHDKTFVAEVHLAVEPQGGSGAAVPVPGPPGTGPDGVLGVGTGRSKKEAELAAAAAALRTLEGVEMAPGAGKDEHGGTA